MRLLKEVQKASRQHKYKYKGYTVNGEVRVKKKKNDHGDHIAILCTKDLEKTKRGPLLVCM